MEIEILIAVGFLLLIGVVLAYIYTKDKEMTARISRVESLLIHFKRVYLILKTLLMQLRFKFLKQIQKRI